MDREIGHDDGSARRANLLAQLDRMVASGRVTAAEAERLRSAGGPGAFDEVVDEIRLRHAGTRLEAEVATGRMSQPEADGFLEQLREGEHPRSLRARLAKHRPATS